MKLKTIFICAASWPLLYISFLGIICSSPEAKFDNGVTVFVFRQPTMKHQAFGFEDWGKTVSSGESYSVLARTPDFITVSKKLDYELIPSFLYDMHSTGPRARPTFLEDAQGTLYIPQ